MLDVSTDQIITLPRFTTPMPPKREAGATPTQPPVNMIKISNDGQEFGSDPGEDKYRLVEGSSYSPFPNNEVRDFAIWLCIKYLLFTITTHGSYSRHFLSFWQHETIEFDEENVASPGIRTDTISLLMKIEQLQAQLKYERRCRILAERELRELKGGWKKMTNLLNNMLKDHTVKVRNVTHCNQGRAIGSYFCTFGGSKAYIKI